MKTKADADFGGYVTKAGLKCSDGRTIMPEAFKHMDGQTVPLVWQHGHSKPDNVLGHVLLEHREDGVYGYGFFNETPTGQHVKQAVIHKDIKALSIYANKLLQRGKDVFHGFIREASLVLSGANPGAFIDYVRIAHSDGDVEVLEDEAVIYTGLTLQHGDEIGQNESDSSEDDVEHADTDSIREIFDSMNEDQKTLVHFLVNEAVAAATAKHSDDDDKTDDDKTDDDKTEGDLEHDHKEGTEVRTNLFEKDKGDQPAHTLSHEDVQGIILAADKGGSLKAAVEDYALQHGIENIDLLFPDARNLDARPEWITREMAWVSKVLGGTRKSPFSRIKTMAADITHDEARAKGYVKGNLKKDEFFGLTRRVTTPTTVYKKQKLDRDDIIDITDFDVVAWMKAEMRVMLDEEIARAILIGDGREVDDEDKVRDPAGTTEGAGIRSILNDHELFVTTLWVDVDTDYNVVAEDILRGRKFYKGSGNPTLFTTNSVMVEMLLSKDLQGKRRWNTKAELAAAMLVDEVVDVEVMEQSDEDLLGIIVNLRDYVVGTDRGGEISMFDDFDIDFNQYKYLLETRLSGALVKIKSAIVVRRADPASTPIIPLDPAYDPDTFTITIPTQTGTTYSVDGTPVADGSTHVLDVGDTVVVTAAPDAGRFFANNVEDEWTYRRRA